ncbi:MAG: trypsin-like serine protease [Cryomorphaceae bacterium]|nr:trypsin-like serine protease [Cryomorphaceae bacterium]
MDGKAPEYAPDGRIKVQRDQIPHQITVKKEGYLDENMVIVQTKKSPLYALSVVPFGILFYPLLYDVGPKAFDYEKQFDVDATEEDIRSKGDNQKNIRLDQVSVDLAGGDIVYKRFFSYKDYVKNNSDFRTNTDDEEVFFENTQFSGLLNEVLVEKGYIDTTEKLFKGSYKNDLMLTSSVEYMLLVSAPGTARGLGNYSTGVMFTELKMAWALNDFYGKPVFADTLDVRSGEFSFDFNKKFADVFLVSIKDCLAKGLTNFVAHPDVQKAMEKSTEPDAPIETLALTRGPKFASKLGETVKSCVTVKTKEGHGSGVSITDNGYIVTNYHVVGNIDSVQVILNDGTKKNAKVVRLSPEHDLVLLKVDDVKMLPIDISAGVELEMADDIYAIGTPKLEDLSQTISRGIVSGFRSQENGTKLIQTDASVNSGNSGGALVDAKGKLVGIVNAKLVGIGIEGVAFAIPVEVMLSALGVEVKAK